MAFTVGRIEKHVILPQLDTFKFWNLNFSKLPKFSKKIIVWKIRYKRPFQTEMARWRKTHSKMEPTITFGFKVFF